MQHRNILTALAPVLLVFAGLLLPAVAREMRTERVEFQPGANSAVVEGRIEGYETADYVLRAREGQRMNVGLATRHGATYFNIYEPGGDAEAVFIGSTRGNQFEGPLQASGDYRIRVYMMRSAARRDEIADYRLEIIITNQN